MKTAINFFCQGDVAFIRRDAVPAGTRPRPASAEPIVVAHSETGHHHVVDSAHATAYDGAAQTLFLELAERATLRHLRGYDTHEAVDIPAGVWEVRRQREYTPAGWRRVED